MKGADNRILPVFPLPETVLFPGVLLPLHIFEPRYRLMLSEVLDSYGKIAVALERREADVEKGTGGPPVWPVMGLGHVITYETRPDGTSYVFLVGETRVRVHEWQCEDAPFHRARFELLEDVALSEEKTRGLRTELRKWLRRLMESSGKNEDFLKLQKIFRKQQDVGFLIDFLAHHFLPDPATKQRLLEELDVEARAQRLCEHLQSREEA